MTEVNEAPEAVVVSADGRRTHFEGLFEDAKQYVADHFPRVHAEPGTHYTDGPTPDVHIVHSDGSKHTFNGKSWSSDTTEPDDEPAE